MENWINIIQIELIKQAETNTIVPHKKTLWFRYFKTSFPGNAHKRSFYALKYVCDILVSGSDINSNEVFFPRKLVWRRNKNQYKFQAWPWAFQNQIGMVSRFLWIKRIRMTLNPIASYSRFETAKTEYYTKFHQQCLALAFYFHESSNWLCW